MQKKTTTARSSVLKTLGSCIGEYRKPTIITLLLMIGEVIVEVLVPFIIANLVNVINAGAELKQILLTGALLVGMTIISLGCGAGAGFTSAKASAGFAKNLRNSMFKRVQDYSFENIDKYSSASLVTRMTTDVSNVQMAFMMLIRIAVRSPLMFVFAIVMAFIMGGWLALSFVIVIPILLVGLVLIAKHAMPAFKSVFKKYDKLNESVEENVQAMRVVKGFTREKYEKEKFENAAENIRKDFTRAERIVAWNMPLMMICMYFNTAFILIVGAKLAIVGNIGVGQISSMLNYGMQILMSLMMFSMIYVMVTMATESARRICEVLNEVPGLTNPEEAIRDMPSGSIDFEDVSFKYSSSAKRYALQDIDLHIPSGATVGIIGGTGSSKSSLVQLIPRLYDATVGTVRVGGIDVKRYELDVLRGNVAMVLQKNQLFSGTIKDNLRWGNENATDAEIEAACKLACADEFIRQFPEGYNTWIEQGGTNVSGGQKQRLCIARALLKKPKVLILDDSTSAVDTKTDAQIRQGFKNYIPETTKIIIAQRISSVQDADVIIVMDNGSIADIGSHEELLTRSPIYREVFQQQVKGGDSNDE